MCPRRRRQRPHRPPATASRLTRPRIRTRARNRSSVRGVGRPLVDDPALAVDEVRKAYRRTVAVDGISFQVRAGEIVGLLGPNGAGKTTTINMVLGVLQPTSGTIRIEGLDLGRHRARAL